MDETELYWKRMPDPSYISKEKRLMPGYTIAKDTLILLFGGNDNLLGRLIRNDTENAHPPSRTLILLFTL